MTMIRIAMLDNWQDVARNSADWSPACFPRQSDIFCRRFRYENTQRTIIVLTNHPGVPGPRIRAHQVAEILFSD
jgi:hypothetical protein